MDRVDPRFKLLIGRDPTGSSVPGNMVYNKYLNLVKIET
jgi:hypothetical protein